MITQSLLCFLLVVTPVAGITIATRNKQQKPGQPEWLGVLPATAPQPGQERHINWNPTCAPGKSCGGRNNAEIAGIMNMAYIFNYLIAIGKHYNAKVHIPGGVQSADLMLEPRHSAHVNASWAHYFDVRANEGNPFNDLHEEEGCKEVWDENTDFFKLFENGETCLTFKDRFDHYTNKHAKNFLTTYKPDIPFSRDVEEAAELMTKKLPKDYGVIHIRRCDRLFTNENCTAVDTIMEQVKNTTATQKIDAWVVFSYAESGYDELLESRLQEMGQKSFFERDMSFALSPNKVDDNYFAYWVTEKVMQGSSVLLNTHNCKLGNFAKTFAQTLRDHDHPDTIDFAKSMSSDLMESRAICTWKQGDPAKPIYRNQQ